MAWLQVEEARASQQLTSQGASFSCRCWRLAITGGVLRDLIGLARNAGEEAYLSGDAQITAVHSEAAGEAFGRTLLLGLDPDDLAKLQSVRKNARFVPVSDKDLALLMTGRVLEYRGSKTRYAVHPTIEPLLPLPPSQSSFAVCWSAAVPGTGLCWLPRPALCPSSCSRSPMASPGRVPKRSSRSTGPLPPMRWSASLHTRRNQPPALISYHCNLAFPEGQVPAFVRFDLNEAKFLTEAPRDAIASPLLCHSHPGHGHMTVPSLVMSPLEVLDVIFRGHLR